MWADCQIGCPGTDFVCDGSNFFNEDGRCVHRNLVEDGLKAEGTLYEFDDNFSDNNENINRCGSVETIDKCQCEDKKNNLGIASERCQLGAIHNFDYS